nr:MAG TPA: intron associated endonuclease [Caudoviricetes sp.]
MTTNPNFGYNSYSGGLKSSKTNAVTRARMSTAQSGKNHPLYGKHRSVETKEKIAASKRGKPLSEECKIKLSVALSGENNPSARPVAQYTKNMILIKVWPYIKAAKAETGANNISMCCAGKQKTSGGYVWRYWQVGGV